MEDKENFEGLELTPEQIKYFKELTKRTKEGMNYIG